MGEKTRRLLVDKEKKVLDKFIEDKGKEIAGTVFTEMKDLAIKVAAISGEPQRKPSTLWSYVSRAAKIPARFTMKKKPKSASEPDAAVTAAETSAIGSVRVIKTLSARDAIIAIDTCLSRTHDKTIRAIRRLVDTEQKVNRQKIREQAEEINRLKAIIKEKDAVLRKTAKVRAAIEELQVLEGVPIKKRATMS